MFIVVVDAPLRDGHGGVQEQVQPTATLPAALAHPFPSRDAEWGHFLPPGPQSAALQFNCSPCEHFTMGKWRTKSTKVPSQRCYIEI